MHAEGAQDHPEQGPEQQPLERLQQDVALGALAHAAEHALGVLAGLGGGEQELDLVVEGAPRGQDEAEVDQHQHQVPGHGPQVGQEVREIGPQVQLLEAGEARQVELRGQLEADLLGLGRRVDHGGGEAGQGVHHQGAGPHQHQADDDEGDAHMAPVRQDWDHAPDAARHRVDQDQREHRHHQRREQALQPVGGRHAGQHGQDEDAVGEGRHHPRFALGGREALGRFARAGRGGARGLGQVYHGLPGLLASIVRAKRRARKAVAGAPDLKLASGVVVAGAAARRTLERT